MIWDLVYTIIWLGGLIVCISVLGMMILEGIAWLYKVTHGNDKPC